MNRTKLCSRFNRLPRRLSIDEQKTSTDVGMRIHFITNLDPPRVRPQIFSLCWYDPLRQARSVIAPAAALDLDAVSAPPERPRFIKWSPGWYAITTSFSSCTCTNARVAFEQHCIIRDWHGLDSADNNSNKNNNSSNNDDYDNNSRNSMTTQKQFPDGRGINGTHC